MEVAKLQTEFLRMKQVLAMVNLSRASVYRLIAAGKFPRPVRLGERSSAFVAHEVNAWVQAKIENRGR